MSSNVGMCTAVEVQKTSKKRKGKKSKRDENKHIRIKWYLGNTDSCYRKNNISSGGNGKTADSVFRATLQLQEYQTHQKANKGKASFVRFLIRTDAVYHATMSPRVF